MPTRATTPKRSSGRPRASAAKDYGDWDDDTPLSQVLEKEGKKTKNANTTDHKGTRAGARPRARARAPDADADDKDVDDGTARVIVAVEYGREGRREHLWVGNPNPRILGGVPPASTTTAADIARVKKTSGLISSVGNVWRAARGAFLPDGYPESVSDDYLAFQVWDTAQGLCSYVRGSLTTRALLEVREESTISHCTV